MLKKKNPGAQAQTPNQSNKVTASKRDKTVRCSSINKTGRRASYPVGPTELPIFDCSFLPSSPFSCPLFSFLANSFLSVPVVTVPSSICFALLAIEPPPHVKQWAVFKPVTPGKFLLVSQRLSGYAGRFMGGEPAGKPRVVSGLMGELVA